MSFDYWRNKGFVNARQERAQAAQAAEAALLPEERFARTLKNVHRVTLARITVEGALQALASYEQTRQIPPGYTYEAMKEIRMRRVELQALLAPPEPPPAHDPPLATVPPSNGEAHGAVVSAPAPVPAPARDDEPVAASVPSATSAVQPVPEPPAQEEQSMEAALQQAYAASQHQREELPLATLLVQVREKTAALIETMATAFDAASELQEIAGALAAQEERRATQVEELEGRLHAQSAQGQALQQELDHLRAQVAELTAQASRRSEQPSPAVADGEERHTVPLRPPSRQPDRTVPLAERVSAVTKPPAVPEQASQRQMDDAILALLEQSTVITDVERFLHRRHFRYADPDFVRRFSQAMKSELLRICEALAPMTGAVRYFCDTYKIPLIVVQDWSRLFRHRELPGVEPAPEPPVPTPIAAQEPVRAPSAPTTPVVDTRSTAEPAVAAPIAPVVPEQRATAEPPPASPPAQEKPSSAALLAQIRMPERQEGKHRKYPPELRAQILAATVSALGEGKPLKAVLDQLDLSYSHIEQWADKAGVDLAGAQHAIASQADGQGVPSAGNGAPLPSQALIAALQLPEPSAKGRRTYRPEHRAAVLQIGAAVESEGGSVDAVLRGIGLNPSLYYLWKKGGKTAEEGAD